MAVMDKQSVREEFDRLKSEFTLLSDNKKIPAESKALFTGLIMLLEVILAIFLEKKTKKTKDNSGKPPSQTEKDNSFLTAGHLIWHMNSVRTDYVVRIY